jgi:hypothetical protein
VEQPSSRELQAAVRSNYDTLSNSHKRSRRDEKDEDDRKSNAVEARRNQDAHRGATSGPEA